MCKGGCQFDIVISNYLKYFSETKSFHFHGIFKSKNGVGGVGARATTLTPLEPPLQRQSIR